MCIRDSLDTLVTHADRGAAMKSRSTREHLNELGVAVHFGRPHTPDDEPWIGALNKSLTCHRDCPEHFPQVADILRWFRRFPDIHNNEPHSAFSFVSPAQALLGHKEVILAQRTRKLLSARRQRLAYYHANDGPAHQYQKEVSAAPEVKTAEKLCARTQPLQRTKKMIAVNRWSARPMEPDRIVPAETLLITQLTPLLH